MSNERKAGAGLAAASGSAPVLRVMIKDIRGAKRNDWDNCPIARAMKRVYPGNDVQVFDGHLLINGTEFAHTEDTRAYSEGWNEGPMRPENLTLPDDICDVLRVRNE